tara:strand:+ start:263 stop:814 length:552 start_codon:yes stop_codon:yes gene_type:complete
MSYKLYTDKQEIFECKISLEGASLTKATSRIIVDTDNLKLMFEGTIDKNGNCKVPIKKLRGLIDEDSKGTMKLEVIAEDTYFNPWESDFEVDTSKKIKVEVKQQDKPLVENSKPKMVIEKVKHPFEPVNSIVDLLKNQNINVKKLSEQKKIMIPILKDYSEKSGYKLGVKKFIEEVIKKLAKQ